MTPALTTAKRLRIPYTLHEYHHDPAAPSYGLEAAEKLGADPARVFKTLVVRLDGGTLAVGVVPVAALLSLKQIARCAGAKKAEMADPAAVERSTGYVLGGVSPLGQKRRLATFIDLSAREHATIFVSAGRRGLEIELPPEALASALDAVFAELAQ